MNNRFDYAILEAINNAVRTVKASPLMLGGVAGSGGGIGGPAGGFAGYLPQTRVAYDLSEVESSGIPESGWSLLDNLNHIRYRLGVVESGASVVIFDDNTLTSYLDTTSIHFSGAGVSVIDLGGGAIQAVITSTGSGGSGVSSFIELSDTPSSYSGNAGKSVIVNPAEDGLIFTTISGGSSGSPIAVYDSSAPVATGIIILDFGTDLDVIDLGGGHVLINSTASGTASSFIVQEDLSSLAAGVTHHTTFHVIQSGTLSVYYNGIRQEPINHYIEDGSGEGFTTLFTPASGDVLLADYLTTSSGYPTPTAGTTIIYSGSAGHIIQEEGTSLASRSKLNFVGENVTVIDDPGNDTTVVTISGSSPVISSTYTPILSNLVNVASYNVYDLNYLRVGNIATVGGVLDIDPTAAGVVSFELSVPVATTFVDGVEGAGCGFSTVDEVIKIIGETTTMKFYWLAAESSSRGITFTFIYRIM